MVREGADDGRATGAVGLNVSFGAGVCAGKSWSRGAKAGAGESGLRARGRRR